ncbi:SAM-dependent methyltransferase [Planosporangium sp. 12N6]|uniref:SAM-dependent methyltransferase n=1 Tax=Planosporangium spinosum TaxID=3402278 RepID=UPI003CF6EB7F
MELPNWVPDGVDITVPNVARAYDYFLGGYHNFAVDREFVTRVEAVMPGFGYAAHANRAFLGRVVRRLAAAGIRQFLDIGSGIPTLGNVHEVAQKSAPDVRVVYVDIDPVAVAHGQAILADDPRAASIEADLRRPTAILGHPRVLDLLDFSQPVAVLLMAVLHFVPDSDDPGGIVATFRDALAPGSYIAISHVTDLSHEREIEAIRKLYEHTPTPGQPRTAKQIEGLLAGLEILEPGVVQVDDWHPDPEGGERHPQAAVMLGAVGRKP